MCGETGVCVVEKDVVAKATTQGYLVGTLTAFCRQTVSTGCGWNEHASEILEAPTGQNLSKGETFVRVGPSLFFYFHAWNVKMRSRGTMRKHFIKG